MQLKKLNLVQKNFNLVQKNQFSVKSFNLVPKNFDLVLKKFNIVQKKNSVWILIRRVFHVISLFIGSTKIPEREGRISPFSFHGQLPDY